MIATVMMITALELHLLGDCGVGVGAANKCDKGGELTGHIRAGQVTSVQTIANTNFVQSLKPNLL